MKIIVIIIIIILIITTTTMYLRTFIIFAYKTRASILEMKCCHKLVFMSVLMHEFLKGKTVLNKQKHRT